MNYGIPHHHIYHKPLHECDHDDSSQNRYRDDSSQHQENTQNTQSSTQPVLDPRRLGLNGSGLREDDIADVICILHPSSAGAQKVVAYAADRAPQHILQNEGLLENSDERENVPQLEEQETIIVEPWRKPSSTKRDAKDLALRFSSQTIRPVLGFVFGRNEGLCDIVLNVDSAKRISNAHFRIFINNEGIVMLEDTSTNGTIVDQIHLRTKPSKNNPATPNRRMLEHGSIIHIPSVLPEEHIRFIVTIPNREGYVDDYARNFHWYQKRVAAAGGDRFLVRPNGKGPTDTGTKERSLIISNNRSYGMHWNGGTKYNVVGVLGKGAFATVYKLATAMDGQIYAAKELEKKRFVKNGRLDQRIENEMQIMQTLRHRHIVQYIEYKDVDSYLYIIMEFLPYGNLQEYLNRRGMLPESAARQMSRQILSALGYLHRKKITHRDIKPDNILIACENPFEVKLTDFGLSKVVKNNETFLKTFCGTLLYCAPEVFPHYNNYTADKKKRRRGDPTIFHSYSSSVDIWSYAAVLWLALCGKPPFEGVMDATGRGMFDQIMGSRPDPTPLRECAISEQAIDLLLKMLNTDPSERPTEMDCLKHEWLNDRSGPILGDDEAELHDIPEEDEDNDADLGAQDLSQLSIRDNLKEGGPHGLHHNQDELNFDSADFEDLVDPRQSKRVCADQILPRNQPRGRGIDESQDISFPQNLEDSSLLPHQPARRQARLFGEIGESALQSSGILSTQTNRALALNPTGSVGRTYGIPESAEFYSQCSATYDSPPEYETSAQGDPSLLGTESLVRDLNMASPHTPPSSGATPNEPATPKTPESRNSHSQSQELTPKPREFNRQIDIYQPSSSYEGHLDHHEESPRLEHPPGQITSLPATMTASARTGSIYSSGPNSFPEDTSVAASLTTEGEFIRPMLRFGKLTSTKRSINLEDSPITLELGGRVTSWGRNPQCTIVYPDGTDTRVPKNAFCIWFHGVGIECMEGEGRDWTKLKDLYTGIQTQSRNGIWINGVHLRAQDKDGVLLYGRIHSGDVVTVFQNLDSKEELKFKCELYYGEGKKPRTGRFEVCRQDS